MPSMTSVGAQHLSGSSWDLRALQTSPQVFLSKSTRRKEFLRFTPAFSCCARISYAGNGSVGWSIHTNSNHRLLVQPVSWMTGNIAGQKILPCSYCQSVDGTGLEGCLPLLEGFISPNIATKAPSQRPLTPAPSITIIRFREPVRPQLATPRIKWSAIGSFGVPRSTVNHPISDLAMVHQS